jgi:hypothetical protein
VGEARQIAREDSSLIYCVVEPTGWTIPANFAAGYNVDDYFRGATYLGPDEAGVEPTWADATHIKTEKHTPGPWKSTDYTAADLSNKTLVETVGDGINEPRLTLAIVFTPSGSYKERESNGHLIAAAPELLAALEKMVEHASLAHWDKDDSVFGITCDQAIAAIAKAKGGAPGEREI